MHLTPAPFPLVFFLALCDGLPLHVDRGIQAATGKRVDVVDHPSLARPFTRSGIRAGVFVLKFDFGALAALDTGVGCKGQQQDYAK